MKLHFAMKTRALLTGIAAVFLATGAARAEEKVDILGGRTVDMAGSPSSSKRN